MMNNMKIKKYKWENKKRTMLRYINPGDIFCFEILNNLYGFGRILSEVSIGHCAEIYDFFSAEPVLDTNKVMNTLIDVIILDAYSLFDKKLSGDWRIIGKQVDYIPNKNKNAFFTYGYGPCFKVDMWKNTIEINCEEAKKLPRYTSKVDLHVKEIIIPILKLRNII